MAARNKPSTQTGTTEGEEDEDVNIHTLKNKKQDWFFDLILNFIKSPRWKTPVLSFIDEYCIIFDDEDENKFEYTDLH